MRSKECPICFTNEILNLKNTLHPKCLSCSVCITNWVITKIQEMKVVNMNDKIPCHMQGCSNKARIKDIYLKLTFECREKINEALFQVYLIKQSDIRKCCNAKCSYAGILSSPNCKESLQCEV